MHQLASEPGRPRLTWYGADSERIELSGRVLDNWVTKVANLLVEEYEAGPDTRILVDLGPHWRTVVWALAAWRTGACVVLPADGDRSTAVRVASECDVVVTSEPASHAGGGDLIAVPLAGLARAWEGELPPGAVDGATAVMSHGDVLTWMPETEPDSPAVEVDGTGATFADLFGWAQAHAADLPAGRRLVTTAADGAAVALATALNTYVEDGSVVLCDPTVSAELAADPARQGHLRATERIDG